MPTYEYRCRDCGEDLEVQQSFSDDPLTECPSCGGSLRKIFGNVGIAFKGSGFYKNDSRGSSSGSSSGSSGSSGSGASSSTGAPSDAGGSSDAGSAGSSDAGAGGSSAASTPAASGAGSSAGD